MNIGDAYSWIPAAFEGASGITGLKTMKTTVHGRVVYINETHRYFTVEAACNGYKLRESFKF